MQRAGGAPNEATDEGAVAMANAREGLAMWLRQGRTQRKLSVEDVAKITKIQPRILDKLERGELEGLPADVFVRGFVRSFAKCVGLDEGEAVVRYGACRSGEAASTPVARALVESMGLAATRKAQGTPAQPTPVVKALVETMSPTEPIAESAAVESTPVVETAAVVEAAPVVETVIETAPAVEAVVETAPVVEISSVSEGVALEQAIAVVAIEQPEGGKKKRSRKKSPTSTRGRKGKKAEQQVTAAEPVADAIASVEPMAQDVVAREIIAQQIETGPIAKIDAASLETTAIEAKTDDAKTVDAKPDDVSTGLVEEACLAEGSDRFAACAVEVAATDSSIATDDGTADSTADRIDASEPEVAGTWQPTMPPIATTPSVPWRRPSITASRAYVLPTLVIDDADPDSADREREDRTSKEHRLSFLPPILLDREDRSARQGGLTLAVIILLIAATLTLSYLMRRPSASGDGVTMLDGTTQITS